MPMMGQPRGRPSMLNQLVAPNRPLPQPRAQGALVGMPKPLPGLIQTGPQPQGLVQSSRFTGGNVPGGALSLTHPEQQPTFEAPQFQTPQAPMMPQMPQSARLAPILASLAAAGGLAGAPSGATTATPGPFTTPPPAPFSPFTPPPPVGQAIAGGAQNAAALAGPQAGNAIAGGAAQAAGSAPGLGALLAALAQQGRRLGNVPRL